MDAKPERASEMVVMYGAVLESRMRGLPLSRKVAKTMRRPAEIRIPFIRPNPAPQRRSTQPRNTTFKRYLMRTPRAETAAKMIPKMIRKLMMLSQAAESIKRLSWLARRG